MKWFKHLSDASDNRDIMEIEALFGLEGYARWWKLLETVALQMDETDRCSVALPWIKWQTILRGKRNKLQTFLDHLQNKSLLFLECSGDILEIKIPKLASYRDNHSKNLQGASKLRVKSKEIDHDPPLPPTGEGADAPGVIDPVPFEEGKPHQEPEQEPEISSEKKKPVKVEYSADFEALWAAHIGPRRGVLKAKAFDRYKRAIRGGVTHEQIVTAHRRYLGSSQWRKQSGEYVPALAVWLNGKPWDDEPEPAQGGQVTQITEAPSAKKDWFADWTFGKGTFTDREWAASKVGAEFNRARLPIPPYPEVTAMCDQRGLRDTLDHYRKRLHDEWQRRKAAGEG